MRKALGLIALLISSALLLVSPALARDRDDYRHGDRRSYGGYYYSYPYSYGYSAPYSDGYSYPYNSTTGTTMDTRILTADIHMGTGTHRIRAGTASTRSTNGTSAAKAAATIATIAVNPFWCSMGACAVRVL